jgi:hypothetical protein
MTMATTRRYRFCGVVLPAWYPVPGEPNGAMLLTHMAQSYPTGQPSKPRHNYVYASAE